MIYLSVPLLTVIRGVTQPYHTNVNIELESAALAMLGAALCCPCLSRCDVATAGITTAKLGKWPLTVGKV